MKRLTRRIILKIFYWAFPDLSPLLKKQFRLLNDNENWRNHNTHNDTSIEYMIGYPCSDNVVKVGRYTYGKINLYSWGTQDEKLEIGDFCSIAKGVSFILGGMHNLDTLTTFPIKKKIMEQIQEETFSKGPIIVEDDVWIGTNATILSGVVIGRGTVVAAGSVVTRSTEPYSIVGGVPARLIRYRFDEDIISKMDVLNFKKLDAQIMKENVNTFYSNDKDVIFDFLCNYEDTSNNSNI